MKYRPQIPVHLPFRKWPSRILDRSFDIVSVDLRDGNQSLPNPMNITQKIKYFQMLCAVGFKTIEVAFPVASSIDYDFVRTLILDELIPNDVTIQVACSSKIEHLAKTIECLNGCERAVLDYYTPNSPSQRRYVFNKTKSEMLRMAVDGAKFIKANAPHLICEYTLESGTATEPDYAIEIASAIMDVIGKGVITLAATVELFSPNVFADYVEYFIDNLHNKNAMICVHPHNDRGTAVAATELAILAGASRVEGCLFGLGERTGNVDIMTLSLNYMQQGISTGLDFSNLPHIKEVYEECTNMRISPRHPYVGDLVFSAFSGGHQDAIAKSLSRYKKNGPWDIPYLHIDPADIGREYQPIRINGQSGSSGIAFIMKSHFGIELNLDEKKMLANAVQSYCDANHCEIKPEEIKKLWESICENCEC